ncbi:MAG TPA: hypothetical protein VG096_17895 [Bryobacteraceae bacterium]|nr:hypothetical protein [Bryobacteraceae bacterium]
MKNLAIFIFSGFEDDGIKPVANPTYGEILLRNVGSLIKPVWPRKQLLRFLEPNATLGIRSEPLALSTVEAKPQVI